MSTLRLSLPNLCRGSKWVWHSTPFMGVLARSQLVRSSIGHSCRTYTLLQCDSRTFSNNLLRRYFHKCSGRYDTRHTKFFQRRLLPNKGYQISLVRWTANNSAKGKDVTKALPKASEIRRLLSIAKPEKWRIAGRCIKIRSFKQNDCIHLGGFGPTLNSHINFASIKCYHSGDNVDRLP